MSDSRPPPKRPPAARTALEALAGAAGDPLRRALWLDALDQRLRPHLPPSLAAHAQLANVDGGKLVYVVDGPVWHARLRLAAPELLDVARSIGLEVTELVVKTTRLPLHPLPQARRTVIPMSTASRDALEAALAPLSPPKPDSNDDSS